MKFFNVITIAFLTLFLANAVLHFLDADYTESVANIVIAMWYSIYRVQQIEIDQLKNDLFL